MSISMHLPTDPAERKATPIATGVIDYFPLAIAEIARVSKAGNEQHNPGQPLRWDRTKSLDHADCIARHLIDRGTVDSDGMRHSAKLAWRAMALLQTEMEIERDAAAVESFPAVPEHMRGAFTTTDVGPLTNRARPTPTAVPTLNFKP